MLIIPSLINPPYVLDLSPANSMLRFLCSQGHDIHRIDWGVPTTNDRAQDLSGHVTELLLPLAQRWERPPILVGYCLGGTMALALASLLPCTAVATLAAPWHFDAYPEDFRRQAIASWEQNAPMCDQLGLMPMEVLQAGFWELDPARTVAKYAAFGDLPEDDPAVDAFLLLEDWANEGAPLTYAAGRDLMVDLYGANSTGNGQWRIGSVAIDPAALTCPAISFVSTTDRIVPAAATPPADRRIDLDLGHVGMVVGRRAHARLWTPLSTWLHEITAAT